MTLLVLDKAEDIAGRSSAVQNLRGVALQRAGDANGAYAAFKKAVELDPSSQLAHANLAAHYAMYGFEDKAKAELKKANNYAPRGEPSEHPNLARVLAPADKSSEKK